MMSGKEKLYFLLDAIDDARAIAPSGKLLMVDPLNDLNGRLKDHELSQLFTKLEKDEGVLRVIKIPGEIDGDNYYSSYNEPEDSCYRIELLPAFDDYFLKIQQEPEYQEFTGKKPATPRQTDKAAKTQETQAQDIVYEVKYLKGREILVNSFLIAKPDFNRENEIVFTYIYRRPNERISKEKIENENGIKLTKTLPKILENLGFVGELRKVFFDVSNEGLLFRNKVAKKDLDELGIKFLRLK